MKLKNYTPAYNQILLELKEYKTSAAGIIMIKPEAEKIMKVLKVGPTCQDTKAGDYVLVDGAVMIQLSFIDEQGKDVQTLQTKEYSVIAYYKPDEDESKFYTVVTPGEYVKDQVDDIKLNILKGTDENKSSFLKEHRATQEALYKGESLN